VKPALVIVDMIKDNISTDVHSNVGRQARAIIPKLKIFNDLLRSKNIPIIYANDSFLKGDFIFQGKLKEHAIRGTEGTQVIDELRPQKGDYVIEKLRFSAFFKTDLDQILRRLGVDTVLVAGISTMWCVLITAADAVSNDFKTIILEDLTACHKEEIHEKVVGLYRSTALFPLLKILPSYMVIKSE